MPMLRAIILPVVLLFGAAAGAGQHADEIEYLIGVVAQSDHRFLRNGEYHRGPEAADHLRKKYEYSQGDIHSADEFIEQVASGSWLSGAPYKVELAGGGTRLTRDWLTDQLASYRRGHPETQGASKTER